MSLYFHIFVKYHTIQILFQENIMQFSIIHRFSEMQKKSNAFQI